MNKVVVRYRDGRIVKGHTADFVSGGETFHVSRLDAPGQVPEVIRLADLKAVFFVKDFAGNPLHDERKQFDGARGPGGRKLRIEFADGEVLVGTTQVYEPGQQGFFLVPADAASNMERCFVVTSATAQVILL